MSCTYTQTHTPAYIHTHIPSHSHPLRLTHFHTTVHAHTYSLTFPYTCLNTCTHSYARPVTSPPSALTQTLSQLLSHPPSHSLFPALITFSVPSFVAVYNAVHGRQYSTCCRNRHCFAQASRPPCQVTGNTGSRHVSPAHHFMHSICPSDHP